MDYREFLGKLENVQENGRGWTARCPCHDDNRNSLSVSLGGDDRVLIHCHAGCPTADVVKAVGIRLVDLFPPQPTLRLPKAKGRIVAQYDYRDADGVLVYQAVRLDPKGFRQRRPDGNGGWIWDMKGVAKVPYRLPELLAAQRPTTVFVPEGEKDVDRLFEAGLVATCNVGGAGKALFEGEQQSVHVRLAEGNGKIYLDLCNRAWQAVEIDADGWRVVDRPPVKFRRAKAMLPLPAPIAGGTVADLSRFLNVTNESWPLVMAWTVSALRPRGPYPVLNLTGEQGSAKSTAARVLRACIDPNSAPVRAEPREPRDLMIAANNGWIVALDNLSYLRPWLSDELCRLSTGGGFSPRMLYENDEETIFDSQRPVIVNGIEELATRGDLVDRSLIVSLPRIPENRRRPESALWREFEEARPGILGALLTAVATAIRNTPSVKLTTLPRMADFAIWATAAEETLGLMPGQFMETYGGNRQDANDLALEASPVAKFVMELPVVWEGTATDLLAELEKMAPDNVKRLKSWPNGARALSGILKRLAPNLRDVGVEVEIRRQPGCGRADAKRARIISIRKTADLASPSPPTVPPAENSEGSGDSGGTQGGRKGDKGEDGGTQTGDGKPLTGANGDEGDAKSPPFSNDRERILI